ncbi:MAG: DUF5615 family PIN-like protein [Rhizomicrobium sp.]
MGAAFICDVHIPPQLAKLLRAKGHNAVHAIDLNFGTASDPEICRYAIENSAIIITKDQDFIELHASLPGPRIVLVRLGNCANSLLLRRFEESLAEILAHFETGIRLVELS